MELAKYSEFLASPYDYTLLIYRYFFNHLNNYMYEKTLNGSICLLFITRWLQR